MLLHVSHFGVRRRRVTAALLVALAPAACTRDEAPTTDRIIDIGSHRLQLRAQGEGRPTVVIDTGMTDELDRLGPLQERISRVTRVITYNRAGYGLSEAGPLPRDSGRVADELKALLDHAPASGPYVLVGHSVGALNLQVFASRYPGDVAALILLDPPPLSFLLGEELAALRSEAQELSAQWQASADSAAKSADASTMARAEFFRMIASERREMFGRSARLAAAITSFGDTPLVVMAAGTPNPIAGDLAAAYQRHAIEQGRALAGKSSRGTFVLAQESSHYLYLDAPELVLKTIVSVVEDRRGGSS